MSNARLSIFIYSIYLAGSGLVVALIPNQVLPLVGLPTTNEVWIRLFCALAVVLGVKGFHYSRMEIESMFQLDVYTRTCFATFLLVFVLLGEARPILLTLSVIDYAGALWTQLAIWADRRAAQPKAA